MRILHVLDTLEIGGAEVSTLEIARRFQATEVTVAQLYPGDSLRRRFEAAGIRVIPVDLPGRYAVLRGTKALSALLEEIEPNLLHATLFRSGIIARLAARHHKIPLLDSFVNDSYSPHRWASLSPLGRLKLSMVRHVDRWTTRWVSHFVAISKTVMETQCRALGVPPDKVTVIHRGRDPDDFAPLSPERRMEIRKALGFLDNEWLLLNVARLLNRKGHRELLEAFLQVTRQLPGARLLLAGEGPERAALEQKIDELGLVGKARLLGSRPDVAELLAAADLFVFPSHYEGHGGALVEAMMSTLPIVASDTPVHRESIEPGRTGLLVPLEDPDALAAAMLRLLRDRPMAERLGREARRVACERFSIETVAARHEALYREIAGESA